jgi:hypothetical protein
MNYDEINTKFLNKTFIISFIVIFMALYIFVSFIKFLGQLPILVLISYGITYLIMQAKTKNKMMESDKSESIIESFKLF